MKKKAKWFIFSLLAGLTFAGIGYGSTIKADTALVDKGVQAMNQSSSSSKKQTKQQAAQQSLDNAISKENASASAKQAKKMNKLTNKANNTSSKKDAFYKFTGKHKTLTLTAIFVVMALVIGGVAVLGGIF